MMALVAGAVDADTEVEARSGGCAGRHLRIAGVGSRAYHLNFTFGAVAGRGTSLCMALAFLRREQLAGRDDRLGVQRESE
jgi:hypothetical protein